MDSPSGKQLQCVVVTPERAVLDAPAQFVELPMYDGELGVLPGRAPLIGRLGAGELRVQQNGTTKHYFVDGGFAQVRADVVTVLTPKALPAEEINRDAAAEQLATALATLPKSEAEQDARQKAEQRARAQMHIADKVRGEL